MHNIQHLHLVLGFERGGLCRLDEDSGEEGELYTLRFGFPPVVQHIFQRELIGQFVFLAQAWAKTSNGNCNVEREMYLVDCPKILLAGATLEFGWDAEASALWRIFRTHCFGFVCVGCLNCEDIGTNRNKFIPTYKQCLLMEGSRLRRPPALIYVMLSLSLTFVLTA